METERSALPSGWFDRGGVGTTVGRMALCLVVCASLLLSALANAATASSWSQSVELGSAGYFASPPELAMNERGDAIAEWESGPPSSGPSELEAAYRNAQLGRWEPAATIAQGPINLGSQVAIDSRGDAIVVWRAGAPGDEASVWAAVRLAGVESWSAPVELGTDSSSLEGRPSVVFDGRSDAYVAWPGPRGISVAVYRASGGTWEKPYRRLPTGKRVRVVVDPRGDLILLWEGFARIEGAVVLRGKRRWQGPLTILGEELGPGADPRGGGPALAVDGQDEVLALWSSRPWGSGAAGLLSVHAAQWSRRRGWRKPVVISPRGWDTGPPYAASDTKGDTVAVWDASNGGPRPVTQAAVKPSGRSWRPAIKISTGQPGGVEPVGQPYPEPRVGLTPSGGAVAAWELIEPNFAKTIQADVTTSLATGFGEAVDLAGSSGGVHESERVGEPDVGVDASGEAIAVWQRERTGGRVFIEMSEYGPAGAPIPVEAGPR
jgi:hypothetical protein